MNTSLLVYVGDGMILCEWWARNWKKEGHCWPWADRVLTGSREKQNREPYTITTLLSVALWQCTHNSWWPSGQNIAPYLPFSILLWQRQEEGQDTIDPYPNARFFALQQSLTHRQVPNAQFLAWEVLAVKVPARIVCIDHKWLCVCMYVCLSVSVWGLLPILLVPVEQERDSR